MLFSFSFFVCLFSFLSTAGLFCWDLTSISFPNSQDSESRVQIRSTFCSQDSAFKRLSAYDHIIKIPPDLSDLAEVNTGPLPACTSGCLLHALKMARPQ